MNELSRCAEAQVRDISRPVRARILIFAEAYEMEEKRVVEYLKASDCLSS